jgi:mRNA interferase RelE/StbE
MAYQVELLPSAHRDLRKLPRPIQIQIAAELHQLAENPRPAGVVKLVGAENLWRIRIGNYRVVYEIHDDRLIVLVLRVAYRKDVYRG